MDGCVKEVCGEFLSRSFARVAISTGGPCRGHVPFGYDPDDRTPKTKNPNATSRQRIYQLSKMHGAVSLAQSVMCELKLGNSFDEVAAPEHISERCIPKIETRAFLKTDITSDIADGTQVMGLTSI